MLRHRSGELQGLWTFTIGLASLVSGLVAGCNVGQWSAPRQVSNHKDWEIDDDWRKSEVDAMYAKFLANDVKYFATIEIAPSWNGEVSVVDSSRGADYGFIGSGELPAILWITDPQKFQVKKYNECALFVVLRPRFIRNLTKRMP